MSGILLQDHSDYFNPYKINQNYLSVFRVSFENKSSAIQNINLRSFQIASGEELLYPLSFTYFENRLDDEQEKLQNIYRMNMPNELTITPSQRITKYLAIPAINPRNESLQIQFLKESDFTNFDFIVSMESITNTHVFEKYNIDVRHRASHLYPYYYFAVHFDNEVSFATKDKPLVYISDQHKEIPASFFGIGVHKDGSKVVFTKRENFLFKNLRNNKIELFF